MFHILPGFIFFYILSQLNNCFLNKAKPRMNRCAIMVTLAESQTRGYSGMTVELLVSCILFVSTSGQASKNLRKCITKHFSMAVSLNDTCMVMK